MSSLHVIQLWLHERSRRLASSFVAINIRRKSLEPRPRQLRRQSDCPVASCSLQYWFHQSTKGSWRPDCALRDDNCGNPGPAALIQRLRRSLMPSRDAFVRILVCADPRGCQGLRCACAHTFVPGNFRGDPVSALRFARRPSKGISRGEVGKRDWTTKHTKITKKKSEWREEPMREGPPRRANTATLSVLVSLVVQSLFLDAAA